MSNTPMRDLIEGARHAADRAELNRADALAERFPIGLAVVHSDTGRWQGRVVDTYITRHGRERVQVNWFMASGKPMIRRHDATLIRPAAVPPDVTAYHRAQESGELPLPPRD